MGSSVGLLTLKPVIFQYRKAYSCVQWVLALVKGKCPTVKAFTEQPCVTIFHPSPSSGSQGTLCTQPLFLQGPPGSCIPVQPYRVPTDTNIPRPLQGAGNVPTFAFLSTVPFTGDLLFVCSSTFSHHYSIFYGHTAFSTARIFSRSGIRILFWHLLWHSIIVNRTETGVSKSVAIPLFHWWASNTWFNLCVSYFPHLQTVLIILTTS